MWKQQWFQGQTLGLGEDYEHHNAIIVEFSAFIFARQDPDFIIGGYFNGVVEGDLEMKGTLPWIGASGCT